MSPLRKYSVCIAIPALNEERSISSVLTSLIDGSNILKLNQVLVADGGSVDRTRIVIQGMASNDSRIQIIENPKKIQSHGLNEILRHCTADIFLRADAHCIYANDYVERCVQALLTSGARNVGGCQRFVANSIFTSGISIAACSFFGNGGAKYRDPTYTGYADTVFLGCFWTEDLKALGGYDTDSPTNEDSELNRRMHEAFSTEQVTNQDAELNARLDARQPGSAIYISSDIRVWYFPRDSARKLWVQYFRYGRGRCQTLIKHRSIPLRSITPTLALTLLLTWFLIDLFVYLPGQIWVTIGLLGLSISIILAESARCLWRLRGGAFERDIWRGAPDKVPSLVSRWLATSVALMIMPVAHSFGMLYQSFRRGILRVQGW